MKRTYRPSNKRRKRTHGFRERMSTPGGRAVIRRRRARGSEEAHRIDSAQAAALNAASQRFPAASRIQQRRDFLRVERQGNRAGAAHFVVLTQARGSGVRRLGITVSRRVGGSVVRSRVKRLVREVFRRQPGFFPQGDTVVIARTGAGTLSYAEVATELTHLWLRTAPKRTHS